MFINLGVLRTVGTVFHTLYDNRDLCVSFPEQRVGLQITQIDIVMWVKTNHMFSPYQVVLPGPIDEEELDGVFAVSRVSLREGGGLQHTEVWAVLRGGQVLIYPTDQQGHRERLTLNLETQYSKSHRASLFGLHVYTA